MSWTTTLLSWTTALLHLPAGARALRLAAALAAACACAGALPAGAQAALPPQGVYEQCSPASDGLENCLARLADIRAGGFTMVLNYQQWAASRAQLQAYTNRAAQLGVKLIYPLNHAWWRENGDLRKLYRPLSRDCAQCTDTATFKRWALQLAADSPSTWGYYIGDEATADQLPLIEALRQEVKQVAPQLPQLFVSMEGPHDPGGNLRPFGGTAEVVASDYYPVGTADPIEAWSQVASSVQSIADANGRRPAFVMQAFSWAAYPGSIWHPTGRFPTPGELQRQRDLVLANSRPEFLLWYSYFNIQRGDNATGHWNDLKAAAFAPEPIPETSIADGPVGEVAADGAQFSLTTDLGASFECRLDDRAWEPCNSGIAYAGLSPGTHTFAARAIDRTGRIDSSPAERSWSILAPARADGPQSGVSSVFASSAKTRLAKKLRACKRLRKGSRRTRCIKRVKRQIERQRRADRRRSAARARNG